MKVLVACEFSGRVRDAFLKKGHEAISCDILPTEVPGPHYQGDVADILHTESWDLIIAHPPCTYLAKSGVRWLGQEGSDRWQKMVEAAAFFNLFLAHPCKKVCIENPVMHRYAKSKLLIPHYSQKTQPYFHGHPERKATCLWLKGLPLLQATGNVSLLMIGQAKGSINKVHWEPPGRERQKNRSRTFHGIAKAMADQWG